MISVLLPSRDRPDLLARSVDSLRSRAEGEIQVLVAADEDDIPTIEKAADVADIFAAMPRAGYDRLHVYYQALAEMASGDWLLVWGDDCIMMTEGWNALIESLPSDVMVANLASTYSPLCCFPAIRRRAVDAIGMFCTDNPHCDTFWGDIGTAASVISKVDVFVAATSAVKGHPHDFYSDAHQAQMAECARLLRGIS